MQQELEGHIFSWAPPDTDDIVVEVACDFHDWELAFHGPVGATSPAPELAGYNIETGERLRVPLSSGASVAIEAGPSLRVQIEPAVAARIGCASDMRIRPTDRDDWVHAQARLEYILEPAEHPLPAHLGRRSTPKRHGLVGRLLRR